MPVGANSLILPDMLGAFNEGADRGRANLARSTLAKYAQPALGGDQGALAKIYGVDPDAGIKIQHLGQQQQQDAVTAKDEGMARVGKYARMVTTLADAGDMQGAAGLYKTIYPEAAKVLGPNLPPDLDPSMLPHMKQIADSMAPQDKKGLINVGAGGSVFDPVSRQPVYTNPGVEKPAQIVTVNRPDGTTQQFQNTPQGLVPLQLAPQGQQSDMQDPMTPIIQRANALAQSGVPDDQVQ
jgi:hypothetical protein